MLDNEREFSVADWLLAGTALLFLVLIWVLAVWRWRVSADFTALHYVIYFGVDRFGPKSDLFLYPILATAIGGVNGLIVARLLLGNVFWRRITMSLTLLFAAMILAALVLVTLKSLA